MRSAGASAKKIRAGPWPVVGGTRRRATIRESARGEDTPGAPRLPLLEGDRREEPSDGLDVFSFVPRTGDVRRTGGLRRSADHQCRFKTEALRAANHDTRSAHPVFVPPVRLRPGFCLSFQISDFIFHREISHRYPGRVVVSFSPAKIVPSGAKVMSWHCQAETPSSGS